MNDSQMEEHVVTILSVVPVTHNVKRFTVTKPEAYEFKPGQATDVVINKPDWKEERRPFTFTSLNEWNHLEFTIKIYDDHDGVTNQLGSLQAGDELIIHDVFGAINYKGPGTFIAGGAGVTPFIAIFRQLQKNGSLDENQLIFSNKTFADIILKEEFENMLGNRFINTLTEETIAGYDHEKIDQSYLRKRVHNLNQYFYICGPDPMVESVSNDLKAIGVQEPCIVTEQF
jgi:ferredoxin-NADP reductase